MSLTRRLAAGLPVAGVTILAAVALGGAPASATPEDAAAHAAQPAVMTTPCVGDHRECPGYGYDHSAAPGETATDDNGGVRGNAGYGTVSPSTTPTSPTPNQTTPSGGTNTVPGSVSPTTVPPHAPSPSASHPGGVSPGTLPLTGSPSVGVISLGALLVAAGAGAVWYSRRRRNA